MACLHVACLLKTLGPFKVATYPIHIAPGFGKGSISQYYLSDAPASPLVSNAQRPLLRRPTGPPVLTISQCGWHYNLKQICKIMKIFVQLDQHTTNAWNRAEQQPHV